MRDQVPERPVFKRAKNKFTSWDFNNFAVTIVLGSLEGCIDFERSILFFLVSDFGEWGVTLNNYSSQAP